MLVLRIAVRRGRFLILRPNGERTAPPSSQACPLAALVDVSRRRQETHTRRPSSVRQMLCAGCLPRVNQSCSTAWAMAASTGRFPGLYGFNRLIQQHALAFVALPTS